MNSKFLVFKKWCLSLFLLIVAPGLVPGNMWGINPHATAAQSSYLWEMDSSSEIKFAYNIDFEYSDGSANGTTREDPCFFLNLNDEIIDANIYTRLSIRLYSSGRDDAGIGVFYKAPNGDWALGWDRQHPIKKGWNTYTIDFDSFLLDNAANSKTPACTCWGGSEKQISELRIDPGYGNGREVKVDWIKLEPSPPDKWRWIWYPEKPEKECLSATRYFRCRFNVPEAIKEAHIFITADNCYELFINDASVGKGKNWKETGKYDLSSNLKKGDNILAVAAFNAMGQAGLLVKLVVNFVSGKKLYVVSNSSWLCSKQAEEGWQQLKFDDSSWKRVVNFGSPPCKPWGDITSKTVTDFSSIYSFREDPEHLKGDKMSFYTRRRKVGERMVLSTSLSPANMMKVLKREGFTLYQVDSDHLSTNEVSPGKWNWKGYDAEMKRCKKTGCDWMFFPHFHFPPPWYRKEVPYVRTKCLEHNKEAEAVSIWDPKAEEMFDSGWKALGEHYGTDADTISAFYLGIHGDYGECMQLAGCRMGAGDQKEDWIKRFGNDNNHGGWWCGEDIARKDFKNWLIKKYGSLEKLNSAWRKSFKNVEEVEYPKSPDFDSPSEWLDFIRWYYDSMTNFTEMVMKTARKYFPQTLMMIPQGAGDENPVVAQDNTALPKAAKKYNVDVRSTHGGHRPFASNYASMLGKIASACKFYEVPFWSEPPSSITPEGEVNRFFEAISCGSKGYWDWSSNPYNAPDVFFRYGKFLRVEKPIVDVAMFYPSSDARLHCLQYGYAPIFLDGCTEIRDVMNYDILDERLIQDGALNKNYRVLIFWEGNITEQETLQKIRDWVNDGGVAVAYNFGEVKNVEGSGAIYEELFGYRKALADSINLSDIKKWTRKFGKGLTVFYPGNKDSLGGYYELLKEVVYNLTKIEPGRKDAICADNEMDEVYATLFTDKILYLNPTGNQIVKKVSFRKELFSGYSEVLVPQKSDYVLKLEPYSITPIYFGQEPYETILECEKFSDLGGLTPVADENCSPGEGLTKVAIPAGKEISTTVDIPADGKYFIFLSCVQGNEEEAEILLDSAKIEPAEKLGQAVAKRMGFINTQKGKHKVTLRAKSDVERSEISYRVASGDRLGWIEADFIVISSDESITGFQFGTKKIPIE